tara:strand:- start:572 stop:1456 length:885 start_codon:yes stop_codon:yes gene_type:complete
MLEDLNDRKNRSAEHWAIKTQKILKSNWKKLEKNSTPAKELKNIRYLEAVKFKDAFRKSNKNELMFIQKNLYNGNLIIIKNLFKTNEINSIKNYLKKIKSKKKSSFFKTLQGCPNFHRMIGPKESSKYALDSNRHDFYFFPWNRKKEKLDLFKFFNSTWRILKLLSGLKYKEFEKNKPKDGQIDRILIRKYPNNTGYLEAHTDPRSLRIVSGIHFSELGKHFEKGGLFFLVKNKKRNVEKNIGAGDMALFYHSLKHGVQKVISKNNHFFASRWWVGLTNPVSDEIKNREMQKRA